MKTILVLTDFSINADYTAHYALKLAQKIKANLLVCNIYKPSAAELRSDKGSWPLKAQEENSINDLGDITARLKTQVDEGDAVDFHPEIDQCSVEGVFSDKINAIVSANNVLMGVVSMHGMKQLTQLFSVDHTWNMIEKANFPLLVIPYQVRFKPYKLIAFATDMAPADPGALVFLRNLSQYSDAEILVTHVTDSQSSAPEEELVLANFFVAASPGLALPERCYRVIKGPSVIAALKELAAEAAIDLLVLTKRDQTVFQKVFERSMIKELTRHPAKPVLIFPAAYAPDPPAF